jgi:hypothetical protein
MGSNAHRVDASDPAPHARGQCRSGRLLRGAVLGLPGAHAVCTDADGVCGDVYGLDVLGLSKQDEETTERIKKQAMQGIGTKWRTICSGEKGP